MEEACAAVLEARADVMWTISDDESDASTIGDDVGAVDEPLLDQYLNGGGKLTEFFEKTSIFFNC
jgi:hypothetical protein